MLFAVGGTAFNIIGPKILGNATTEIFNGLVSRVSGGDGIDFGKVGRILLCVLALYLVSAALSFVQGYIMTGISQKMTYRLRREISEKIDRLPMQYFDRMTHGEILSRITNDVDTLGQSLNQSATQVITSVTTILGVLVMMLSISPLMTVIALLILPLSMGLISVIVRHSQRYFKSQQEYLGHINGQVEEVYGGHSIVRAFNKEEDIIRTFDGTNQILYQSAWKSQFFSGMMMPIMQFVGNLGYVAVSILGGWLVIKNAIEVGDIQSFIQYVRQFTQPIQQVAQVANMLQSTAAASERVFAFLEEEEEEKTADCPASTDGLESRVEFDHVHFGYNPDHIIIHDFCAQVEPGQKIAIVGPTGAGKTTMVKLLMRFYDVNSGSIRVGGHDLREFDRHDLRGLFGMVLQDTWLFNGTIEENIRYGRLDATHEEVVEAAKAAYVHRFVADAARRLRYGAQRGGQQCVPGPEAAPDHRQGDPGGSEDPHTGRGHKFGGHPDGGPHPEGHGQPDAGADQLYHRAPPVHDPGRGSDPCHERRGYHRAGPARRTPGPERLLRRALQLSV